MKKSIHPQYSSVVFRDRSADASFLTRSTIDTEGRVEKFNRRYGKAAR